MCCYKKLILQEVIGVINRKGIEIVALMFDGFMLYGNYYDNTDLLRETEQQVNAEFEGFEMIFGFKPHNETIKMPSDFDASKEKENVGVFNDLDATEK